MLSRLVLVAALVLSTSACGAAYRPPPNLTPQAVAAWHGTRAILAIDTLRDIAIAAEMQAPPLMSTADTRTVVLWHQGAVKTILAAPGGWKPVVQTGLTELLQALPPNARNLLDIYVELAQAAIKEMP